MNAKKYNIILLMLIFTATAFSKSPNSLIRQGNKLYNDANYADANQLYESATEIVPDDTVAIYNKANAQLKMRQFDQAIELYKQTAAQSIKPDLAQKAKYNLATAYLLKGMQQDSATAANLEKNLKDIDASIESYRSVLDTQPKNDSAAKNMQIAKLTAYRLRQMIEQQKKMQEQQQQKQKEMQDKLEKLSKDQQDIAQESKQQSSDPNRTPESKDQLGQKQQNLNDQTKQALDDMKDLQQNQDPNQSSPAQQKVEEAIENQTQASKNLDEEKLDDAHKNQSQASENLKQALDELKKQDKQNQQKQNDTQQGTGDQKKDQSKDSQKQDSQQPQQEKEGSQAKPQEPKEQIDADAQQIIDNEEKNSKIQGNIKGTRTVEKDW